MKLAALLCSLALLASILAAGCSSKGGATDPCAAKVDECFGSQKACVSDASGARCVACASGQYAARSGRCEALTGAAIVHDFAQFTTPAGQEILGLCQSWTLNNAQEMWVNAVELEQDAASHHSNWTFVPDDQYNGPEGVWPCSDRKYNELDAALRGGILYAQSTQAAHEVQRFPNGAAVRIPPYSRLIGDVHLLNTSQAPITGHVKLVMYTLAAADVGVKLVPFHLTYQGLALPPKASSRFTGDCQLDYLFPSHKLAMKIYYILPHTHSLATRFFVDVLGGPDNKKSLLKTEGFDQGAHGRAFDPPVDMSAAEGLSFGCQYFNPRSETVKWGFGDQEMCELLGFAQTDVSFESRVSYAERQGTDDATQLFTSKCTTFVFPWDFTKPGGPGPK